VSFNLSLSLLGNFRETSLEVADRCVFVELELLKAGYLLLKGCEVFFSSGSDGLRNLKLLV
jgi:hypothetical protein